MIRLFFPVLAAVMALGLPVPTAIAQEPKSAALAGQLVQQMEQRKLQHLAAKDPSGPDRFVAASYVPSVQLLLISARSTAVDYVTYVLGELRYDEVYASLHGASVPQGKLFVQDMGGNGLAFRPANGAPLDVAYRDVVKTTVFNGDWKGQKMTQQEYREAFVDVDARYAQALSLLLAEVNRQPRQ